MGDISIWKCVYECAAFSSGGTEEDMRRTRRAHLSNCFLTVLDLCNVPDDNLRHFDLDHLPPSDHGELLLLLDSALKPAELLLFAPVVEGCHQHHTDHREEDGRAFDPSRLRLSLLLNSARCFATF